jgi:hypothetical protein
VDDERSTERVVDGLGGELASFNRLGLALHPGADLRAKRFNTEDAALTFDAAVRDFQPVVSCSRLTEA